MPLLKLKISRLSVYKRAATSAQHFTRKSFLATMMNNSWKLVTTATFNFLRFFNLVSRVRSELPFLPSPPPPSTRKSTRVRFSSCTGMFEESYFENKDDSQDLRILIKVSIIRNIICNQATLAYESNHVLRVTWLYTWELIFMFRHCRKEFESIFFVTK